MGVRERRLQRRTSRLFTFDLPFVEKHGCIAGVDEAGCGPLAGPVVAAAVILPNPCRLSRLNDSKQIPAEQREVLYQQILGLAVAVGLGIVESEDIDRLNIRQAGLLAMRLALSRLAIEPRFVLVDGFRIPEIAHRQAPVIDGDSKSAHIAAASVVAKVTRDAIMVTWDQQYPGYGFHQHKGYSTADHLAALRRLGPCPIHRRSYAPVRASLRG